MHSQVADEHGDLWFFTQIQSPKITEVSRDNEVNLAYSDPNSQTYVSVAGKAEIVRDKATIEDKWSEPLRAWFPKGVDDPQIALIRVHPAKGEYWDSPSSTDRASLRICEGCHHGPAAASGRSGEGQSQLMYTFKHSSNQGRYAALFVVLIYFFGVCFFRAKA